MAAQAGLKERSEGALRKQENMIQANKMVNMLKSKGKIAKIQAKGAEKNFKAIFSKKVEK